MDLGEAERWGCRSSCACLDKEPCLQEPLCVLVWSHSLVELLQARWAVGKRRLGRGWRVTGRSWALDCVLLPRGVHVAHKGSAEQAWWQRKFLATSSPGSQADLRRDLSHATLRKQRLLQPSSEGTRGQDVCGAAGEAPTVVRRFLERQPCLLPAASVTGSICFHYRSGQLVWTFTMDFKKHS